MSDDNRSESGLSSPSWALLAPGRRFVVRHLLPEGESQRFTDVVGDVVRIDDETVSLRTRRRGVVTVPRRSVVAIKEIRPMPGRRGQPHRAIDVEALERLSVDGWAPSQRAELGSWLLRSAGGYTGRTDSALAIGQPDRPLPAALEAVEQWYEQLGQPALIHVPLTPGCAPGDDPLVNEADEHGWEWFQLTDVMTAATTDVVVATGAPAPMAPTASLGHAETYRALPYRVEVSDTLSDAWWHLADERMVKCPEGARAALTGSPEQTFLTVFAGELPIARARIAFTHGWGGIYAVATSPEFRRRGLGVRLVGECARAAQARGVESLYLQVSADSAAAISLYSRLGFTRHHQYVYLRRVETP